LLFRYMHDDLERLIARQLPRPADDEFLGVLVEILLAERERVEAMTRISIKLGSAGGDGSLMSASLEPGRVSKHRPPFS